MSWEIGIDIYTLLCLKWASLSGKEAAATQEMWVQALGWENPLEEAMAIHFSILAWRSPWTEKPGGLQSIGSQKSQTRLSDLAHVHI